MTEPDELYTLRNLFWLGNFQLAINEASGLHRLPQSLMPEKDEFIYRSYLALGQYNIILGEIKDSPNTPVALRAIKLLASFLSDPSTKEIALMQMQEWMTDSAAASNTTLQLVSAILYMHDDNIKDAIKSVRHGSSLEQCALLVQLYLRIDRLDLAQKQVKLMKGTDEDHALSMLASAWTNLSAGGGKAQDAAYVYEELIDKYGASAMLLNGLAVSKMQQGQFEEAETHLQEALTKKSPTISPIKSLLPTIRPSTVPMTITTIKPTAPYVFPTTSPSFNLDVPTAYPSTPTVTPSSKPTTPTVKPTVRPIRAGVPSSSPTKKPSLKPTFKPTSKPFKFSSSKPSVKPTRQPSTKPTFGPSRKPSTKPTIGPSRKPTIGPSRKPTTKPTFGPSRQPSTKPTIGPSRKPSTKPTTKPSIGPSVKPSTKPTTKPSKTPL
eukprot:gene5927-11959_t